MNQTNENGRIKSIDCIIFIPLNHFNGTFLTGLTGGQRMLVASERVMRDGFVSKQSIIGDNGKKEKYISAGDHRGLTRKEQDLLLDLSTEHLLIYF